MIPQQSTAPSLAVPHHSTANGHTVATELLVPGHADIYRRLLNNIGVAGGSSEQPSQVIGLTSCGRREGVSTIAANLAWVAARSQGAKVLLIDTHVAAPTLDKLAKLSNAKGLTDFLSCQSELPDCIHEAPCKRLSYLPAGQNRATNFLSQQNLTALFESVRESFDLIVMDLPPVSDWNNCVSFAQHADGVLLVVAKERVPSEVAMQAMQVFQQAEVGLFGVVLNDAG